MIATLLWKDYRQNRRLLIAVAIFLAIPYVVVTIYGGVNSLKEPTEYSTATWLEVYVGASVASLVTLVVASAFIAGNAFAGERVDRSAEFVGYLPIPRRASTISKAILAVGACVAFAACNLTVAYSAAFTFDDQARPPMDVLLPLGATAVLLFGVAWFGSSFFSSPVIAAASGIMLLAIIGGGVATIEYLHGGQGTPDIIKSWYTPLCLLIGLSGFTAGCLHCLRRIEP